MILNIIIMFFLVFSFPLPIVGNSIYLAVLLSCGKIFWSKTNTSFFLNTISSRYVLCIILAIVALIGYTFIHVSILGTNEYSRIRVLISMLSGCIFTIVVYSSFQNTIKSDYLVKLLAYIFIIQTLIEIAAFISPGFAGFVKLFQFENEADIAELAYAGFRGLAISGRLYFEFAAVFGLILIILMKRILDSSNIRFLHVFQFLLIFVGGFFVGRTVLIGLAFSFLLFFLHKSEAIKKWSFIVKLLLSILTIILLLTIILPNDTLLFVKEKLVPWFFDLFLKYIEDGDINNSYSFNSLNEMYDVKISNEEWVIGSGRYTNADGSYYKHVDGGYIRQIFFWGLIGSFFNLIFSLIFFLKPLRLAKKIKNYNDIYMLLILIIYTLTLHYKGEVLGSSRFYYVVLFLYLLDVIRKNSTSTLKIR